MMHNDYHNLKGIFFGLIVGDALGAPVEFMQPWEFEPLTDLSEGGVHQVKKGEWTDDTGMALAISDALIQRDGEVDLRLILDNFLSWYENGSFSSRGHCFDIGNTTRRALEAYKKSGVLIAPTNHEMDSGNGSLMRMGPLFMLYRDKELLDHSLAISRTTHASSLVDEYVHKLVIVVSGIFSGYSKQKLLSLFQVGEECRPTGFVADSFNVALRSFLVTHTFEAGALLVVNQGHDSDTVAAIYGQIAGSYYGFSGIPEKWIEQLHDLPMLECVFEELWKLRLKRVSSA